MGKIKIYLAGGFHSGWQDKVISECPGFEYYDPRTHRLALPEHYKVWDLSHVKQSDILFVVMDRDNPSGYGMALEIGYAKGLDKTVIVVDEKSGSNEELKKAEARLNKLERMEKNLQQLVIEEEISIGDFKEHRSCIEAERAKLNETIETTRARRNLVKADFEIALNLAKQVDFLFDKGTFAERRLLCETLFKRVYINEGKITKTELNSPFSLITSAAGTSSESLQFGSGGWIRTNDLRVMSPTSCHCSTPRQFYTNQYKHLRDWVSRQF